MCSPILVVDALDALPGPPHEILPALGTCFRAGIRTLFDFRAKGSDDRSEQGLLSGKDAVKGVFAEPGSG